MINKNIEIKKFKKEDLQDFTNMFVTYFRDDFEIEISDTGVKKLCEKISKDVLSNILELDLLIIDGKSIGFINSQVDTAKSDWCERDGWGFIREVYIHKNYRGYGLGIKLVKHVEETFYRRSVDKIYLTSDDSGKFWTACGYKKFGEISRLNNDPIFEKRMTGII